MPITYKLAKDVLINNKSNSVLDYMDHNMVLAMVKGNKKIDDNNKIHIKHWRFQLPWWFGGAMRGALPNGTHPGLQWSHWMLPLGECTHRIATVAVLVDNFWLKTPNTNKKLFLACLPTSEEPIVYLVTFILTIDTLNVFFCKNISYVNKI